MNISLNSSNFGSLSSVQSYIDVYTSKSLAHLEQYKLRKGMLLSTRRPEHYIIFGLNPNELKDSKSTEWREIDRPGQESPKMVWSGSRSRVQSFTLYLDHAVVNYKGQATPSQEDVDLELEKLLFFMYPDNLSDESESLDNISSVDVARQLSRKRVPVPAGFHAPSSAIFSWGSFMVEVIVTKVDITRTMFFANLQTRRATVEVELRLVDEKESFLNRSYRLTMAKKLGLQTRIRERTSAVEQGVEISRLG